MLRRIALVRSLSSFPYPPPSPDNTSKEAAYAAIQRIIQGTRGIPPDERTFMLSVLEDGLVPTPAAAASRGAFLALGSYNTRILMRTSPSRITLMLLGEQGEEKK